MDNNIEKKPCPRDCNHCSLAQQVFCSAQMALSTMDMVKTVYDRMDAVEVMVSSILEQLTVVSPIAQEGEVAQKIDSPKQ